MHSTQFEQTYIRLLIKRNQDVHIAVSTFLTTRVGAKKPCFQDGLSLEVLDYLLYHLLPVHITTLDVSFCENNDFTNTHKE